MSVPHRVVSSLPAGTAYSRYLMAHGAGRGDSMATALVAARWRDSPTVEATLELMRKAAVAPGTTTDVTYAAPLAAYGVAQEALQLERGLSVLGALAPRMRRVPFRTKIPREVGSGTGGSWVGEGLSVPVAKTSYDMLVQEAYKASVIVVLTRELLDLSSPPAERTVRETAAAGVAKFLDEQFLNPAITLVAGTRPASVTNGATSVASTGSTAAAIATDLAALNAAVTTPGARVWIMQPRTMVHVGLMLRNAAAGLPNVLAGAPVIPSSNSPQQITLLAPSAILYSDDDGLDISASDEASLQMSDTPTDPATSATVFQSLWNNDLWAVRLTRWLAYLRAQSGSVAYMTVTY